MNNNNEMHQQNDITVNHFTFKQVTSYVIIEYSLAMAQKRKILREWIQELPHCDRTPGFSICDSDDAQKIVKKVLQGVSEVVGTSFRCMCTCVYMHVCVSY